MSKAAAQFDVVVAGAGLTGATLALALARAGVRIALLDPEPRARLLEPRADLRASAVTLTSLAQWRALGLEGEILASAEPIRSILVSDASAPGAARAPGLSGLLSFDLADAGGAAALGFMVPNDVIRRALGRALLEADVALFDEDRAARTVVSPAAVALDLAGGSRLEAALVVGAEGRSSSTRAAAGVRTHGWTYPQSGLVATISLDKPHHGVAHEIFLPGGPLAVLPLKDQRASLVWTETASRARSLAEASKEAFEAHLNRRLGDGLGRAALLGERSLFPLSLQLAESLIAARTALVGDAGHAVHPIAGQGLNLGLKDVAALAEVVVDALRVGEDPGSDLVLQRYQRWRRFDAAGLALGTDLFNRLFSTDHPVVRGLRGAGLALVSHAPRIRRLFVREASGELGDLPRLLRGEAL